MTREQLVRQVTSQVTKARTGQTRQDDEALALKIIQFVTDTCANIAEDSRLEEHRKLNGPTTDNLDYYRHGKSIATRIRDRIRLLGGLDPSP